MSTLTPSELEVALTALNVAHDIYMRDAAQAELHKDARIADQFRRQAVAARTLAHKVERLHSAGVYI